MIKSLLLLGLLLSSLLYADEEEPAVPICSLYYLNSVKKTVMANGEHDKFKHCAVSCMLALRCPAADVLEIGILKELADIIGPGNAEMKDLEADYTGVYLVVDKKVKDDKSCIKQCHKIYPENSCQ